MGTGGPNIIAGSLPSSYQHDQHYCSSRDQRASIFWGIISQIWPFCYFIILAILTFEARIYYLKIVRHAKLELIVTLLRKSGGCKPIKCIHCAISPTILFIKHQKHFTRRRSLLLEPDFEIKIFLR